MHHRIHYVHSSNDIRVSPGGVACNPVRTSPKIHALEGHKMKITKNISLLGGVMLGLSAFLLCVNILSAMVGETLYADMAYVAGCSVIGIILISPHALATYMSHKSHKIQYQDVQLADILDL